ncbi:MAG TPA: peptidylprolyl isomerase [Tepidisphaeraceae bacterium]|jgi:peptidyl-prolyl cis-trans isomerase C|nr:peptidylprolyl isomerase [Tepidisphaeraceae bacterium]
MLRIALIVAVTAAVSMPLMMQVKNGKAAGPAAPAPTVDPGKPAKPVSAFPQVDPNKVVITVGDQKVTAGEFNSFFSELDPNMQARVLARPEAKRQLAEQFVDMKVLSAEAKRLKLDQSLRVKTTYEQLLANAVVVNLAEQKEADQKFFNDNKAWFDELEARHILIGMAGSGVGESKLTDEQAKAKAEDIKKKLDKGEAFATLARAESDDKGSAATGGSLGQMSRGQMVPQFEAAAFKLQKGEISEPVKTRFGYHIIQVLNRTTPTYEQAAQRVSQRRLEVLLEQLKKAAQPEIDDSYFGAAEPSHADTGAQAPAQPTASKVEGSGK